MLMIDVPKIIQDVKNRMNEVGLFDAAAVVSAYSGGKDSTALYLIANDILDGNFTPYMADTDNEHPLTIEYVKSIHLKAVGPQVRIVKKTYTEENFATRRKNLARLWREPHKIRAGKERGEIMPRFSEEQIEQALAVLYPTGNSFLDCVLLHGMFPIKRTRFCTFELKLEPAFDQVIKPILDSVDGDVFQLTGVRADESKERAQQVDYEMDHRDEGGFLHILKPLFNLSSTEIFAIHKHYGIKPNPLYKLGFERVGCMPCVLSVKSEIRNMANRFPECVDRLREWEKVATLVNRWSQFKGFSSSFLGKRGKNPQGSGVDLAVEWSRTERNGIESEQAYSAPACSSKYGLCE